VKQQDESKAGARGGFWLFSMWDSPFMRALCAAITIIGLPLSFFVGRWTEARPSLTIYSLGSRMAVADSAKLPTFEIKNKGRVVAGPVWFADFAVWNQGRAPISDRDVLRSMKIDLGENTTIYDSAVVKSSRSECGLKVAPGDLSSTVVTWKILEEGDGGIIRITYSGKGDARVDGSLIGQHSISMSERDRSILLPESQILVLLYMFAIILILKVTDYIIDRIRWKIARRTVAVGALIVALALCFVSVKTALRLNTPTPPFSFNDEQFDGRDH
jgi:hypothetical protein